MDELDGGCLDEAHGGSDLRIVVTWERRDSRGVKGRGFDGWSLGVGSSQFNVVTWTIELRWRWYLGSGVRIEDRSGLRPKFCWSC